MITPAFIGVGLRSTAARTTCAVCARPRRAAHRARLKRPSRFAFGCFGVLPYATSLVACWEPKNGRSLSPHLPAHPLTSIILSSVRRCTLRSTAQCWNGGCAPDVSRCPCPPSAPVRCPIGGCARAETACPPLSLPNSAPANAALGWADPLSPQTADEVLPSSPFGRLLFEFEAVQPQTILMSNGGSSTSGPMCLAPTPILVWPYPLPSTRVEAETISFFYTALGFRL